MPNKVVLDAITSIATSNIEGMGSYGFEPTLQLVITGTATALIEVSNNGVDFDTISTLTSSGIHYFNRSPAFMRIDVTVLSSGSVTAILDGHASHL